MIDERIRIQENYDMSVETAKSEGIKQGFQQGVNQERRQLAVAMLAKGMTKDLICDIMGISNQELEVLVADTI